MWRQVFFTGVGFAVAAGAASRGCVGSVAVSTFRIAVQPGGAAAAAPVPIHQINNLPSGYRIAYRPIDLPADLKKDAKLALLMVPKGNEAQVTVLEPKAAALQTEWQAPFATGIVVLVFAPQGLDEKRLSNLVTREKALVAALADYADETANLESALEVASDLEQQDDDDDARPPRASTPAEQAIFALVRALNPSISSYNPLGVGRRAGAATLMGKGAEAFFENAGGFIPGGGILPEVKSWLLPDTEFRSVYAVSTEPDGLTLCTQVQPRTRNKIAYLWAYRLTGASRPSVSVFKDGDVPLGLRAGVPVKLDKTSDWPLLNRVFDWKLVAESGSAAPLRVTVRPNPDERALQLDLRKFAGAPGAYRLEGRWDWDAFAVNGSVRVHRLEDLSAARLTPDSQDKLTAGAGPVPVDLTGADFLFVDRAWLHRPGSARQLPVELPPAAADARPGPPSQLHVEVETDGLRPGPYLLALSRIDGAVAEVPIRLLPPPPRLDASGARVNVGERGQRVTFTGSGLDRIERLESPAADIALLPATEDGSRRGATVRLHPDAKAGDRLALSAAVEGMSAAVRFPGVLQVVAARPRILEAKASLTSDLAITPRDGEIPAGSWVSYALRIDPPGAALTLKCAEPARMVQALKLKLGEKSESAQLTAAGEGAWFLSFDPGAAGQSGCTLTATLESEELGASDSFTLGKVVRLPRIESFSMTDEKSPDGFYGLLKGFDLETIEKTGWDGLSGVAVAELPRPLVGEGSRQSLRIAMPWPSPTPKAPLFVWLRGEPVARASKIRP